MRVAVVGAGAAGCFCAVLLGRRLPGSHIDLFEKGPVPMAKLALTGGGRCNLTNTFAEVGDLKKLYPRGAQLMRRALSRFSPRDTMAWWEAEGVRLHEEDGGRIFPDSQDAMQIVRTLRRGLDKAGVILHTRSAVSSLSDLRSYDAVLLASGGGALSMLEGSGIAMEAPVPSLFALSLEDKGLCSLSGISLPGVRLSLPGTAFRSEGALLLTRSGISGPAVLRLSSYAARYLHDNGYRGELSVCWVPGGEDEVLHMLEAALARTPARLLSSVPPEGIPSRLWELLLSRAGLRADLRCAEAGQKGLRRLASLLTSDTFKIAGKAPFKDEFVTCGGVSLQEVNSADMQAKKIPGLFFAGEVLDVDAVTGGFNLQAAWSTAYMAAEGIVSRLTQSGK